VDISLRSAAGPVVVVGDFNAKSPVRGAPREDRRDQALADFAVSTGLAVCNSGERPTFVRVFRGGVSKSHTDVTFVSDAANHLVRGWKVREEYSMSFHQYISFCITSTPERPVNAEMSSRWAWRKFDQTKLHTYLESTGDVRASDAEQGTRDLAMVLKQACDSCMPKGSYRWGKTNLLVDAGHSESTERVLRCSEGLQAQTPMRGTGLGRGSSQAIQRGQEQSQIGNKRQQKE